MAGELRKEKLVVVMMLALGLLLCPVYSKKSSSDNPADDLAVIVNQNRTANKLPALHDNPGLACIALQYIQAYQGQCNEVGPNGEKPADYEFNQTFADNCGVDPMTISDISGIVLACETKYQDASYAFSNLLFLDSKSVTTLLNKNQTEFGAGISGYAGGSPYFWCILFSHGGSNSTFVFSAGKAKYQQTGCFSGTAEPCSGAQSMRHFSFSLILASIIGLVVAIF
ncbi:hypothetical protein O6H91_14G030600 [Diphasiastrum complanatum]|uniref:Uncharacterized protein n=1 Tax=Diphasiastrum complanatum TaxID=34168 RepID=A0ACC2BMU3_DIPCM|nr:hypothetical protein O6H91_Y510000 [Diphasiastrum complanatum]KAJ7531050.1 hypothetical protein O6H91_14G030600 [Diphasiastrum complanatum]